MENQNDSQYERSEKRRNFLLAIGLISLTLILLVFFKLNNRRIGTMIEEGTSSLMNLYTQNLQPLLFKTSLTDEDVFNFALYNNIPVDKQNNQVLQLAEDESNNKIFTVQSAIVKENTDNYNKFKEYLRLDDSEISSLDSILSSYKSDIYSGVLVSDNNTIAVNPELAIVQKAIINDIYEFVDSIKDENREFVVYTDPHYRSCGDIKTVVDAARKSDVSNFIIFAPDTIFDAEFEVDKNDIQNNYSYAAEKAEHAAKIRVKMLAAADKKRREEIVVSIDSEVKKAVVPLKEFTKEINARNIELRGLKKFEIDPSNLVLKFESDSSSNIVKFNINTGDSEGKGTQTIAFEFNIESIDSILQHTTMYFENFDVENWENYGKVIDSIAKDIEFKVGDKTKK